MRKIGYIFIIVLIAFFLYAPFDSEFSSKDKPDLDITFGQTPPAEIIIGCRELLGVLSQTDDKLSTYIMTRPDWTQKSNIESFDKFYNSQKDLLGNGKVVWSSIVQANEDLFKGTNEPLPATVVYSFDPMIDSFPNKLDEISEKVYKLKHITSSEELKKFASIISNENNIILTVAIPPSFTDNIECYYGFIMIEPDFLPNGKLNKRLLPILANPENNETILMLPDDFWDEKLKEFYNE